MRRSWKYIIISAVGLMACTKEPLPVLPQGNDPIYVMKGDLNGEELELNVGLDGVIMNHGIGEINGVKTYYGEIESAGEGEKIRIDVIRQERPYDGTEIRVFNDYTIPYLVHEKGVIRFDFGGAVSQGKSIEIQKPGENGFISATTHDLDEYGMIPRYVRFRDDPAHAVKEINIRHGYQMQSLSADFHVQGGDGVVILDDLGGASNHQWFINDIFVGNEASFEGELSNGIHKITHKISDENGNETVLDGLIRFKEGTLYWHMKINYLPEYDFEPSNYGRVVVSMFKNGEWYRSDHVASNKSSHFGVDSVKFVDLQQSSYDLMAFRFDFSTVLHNENHTDSLILSNMNGTFSVGLE